MSASGRNISLFLFLLSALVTVFITGCSTEKDTFVHRAYHNTTARYNGYYYARLSLNEGLETIRDEYEEDYTQVIPVFENGDEGSAKSGYSNMDRTIKKSSKVIQLHSMDIRGEQKCKWIDDNYFLLGKAHFYKREYEDAVKMFKYVAQEYEDEPIRWEGMLWLARTYNEMEEYGKAKNILQLAEEDREYPEEEWREYYNEIYADLLIRQEKYKEALPRLEIAVEEKRWLLDRKRKTRLLFILAQLYERQGDISKSNRYYSEVIQMNPPYEMAFYAKINRALSYETGAGSSKDIKEQLLKMLKDDKNIDYFDQIYYALAQLAFKENNREKGIEYLVKSTQAKESNKEVKRKAYLQLADLYFEDRDYPNAQAYYDTTLQFIERGHKRFSEVKTKSHSLNELVDHLATVQEQDSLRKVAGMSKKERDQLIDDYIEAAVEEEEEKKRQQEQARLMAEQQEQQEFSAGPGGGRWYFYNQKARSSGFSTFRQRWGQRELEDNWRRSNKQSTLSSSEDAEDEVPDSLKSRSGVITDRSYYLKDVPLKPEEMKASRQKTAKALYGAGLIYREGLEDDGLAIESFQRIVREFDSTQYMAPALYQLYRLYLKKEEGNYFSMDETQSSDHYKNILLERFPDSEYAQLIRDPGYMEEAEKEKQWAERQYQQAYTHYRKENLSAALSACNAILEPDTMEHLKPKFYLLKGLVLGKQEDRAGMEKTLNLVADRFSGTPEGQRAQAILQKMKEQPQDTSQEAQKEAFTMNEDMLHFFAVVFDEQVADVNRIRSGVSDFHLEYYSRKGLDVNNTLLPGKVNMLIVKSFEDKTQAMEYYRTFEKHAGVLETLKGKGFKMFVISRDNFQILFRSQRLEDYTQFFGEQYL